MNLLDYKNLKDELQGKMEKRAFVPEMLYRMGFKGTAAPMFERAALSGIDALKLALSEAAPKLQMQQQTLKQMLEQQQVLGQAMKGMPGMAPGFVRARAVDLQNAIRAQQKSIQDTLVGVQKGYKGAYGAALKSHAAGGSPETMQQLQEVMKGSPLTPAAKPPTLGKYKWPLIIGGGLTGGALLGSALSPAPAPQMLPEMYYGQTG